MNHERTQFSPDYFCPFIICNKKLLQLSKFYKHYNTKPKQLKKFKNLYFANWIAFLTPASMNASKNLADVKSEHITNLSQGKLEL